MCCGIIFMGGYCVALEWTLKKNYLELSHFLFFNGKYIV